MAILDGDIQLLKSEVMDDVDEGGGMATGVAVVDGASNNLFPDISELDRTYGRIAARKVFPAVVTDNTDTYFGAHVIVERPPADPKVSVALFTTGSAYDHYTDARDKLESYLSTSVEGRWMLHGNHLVGQRSVQMHCPESAATPGVDDVLVLQSASQSAVYQYVRVTRIVARESTAFEDSKGTFTRDVITVEISAALRYAFAAAPMERWTSAWFSPPTRIHTTLAADAASYFGVQPLKIAAALGALSVRVSSIFTQLVPSALSETAIVDARCTGDRTVVVPIAGATPTAFSLAVNVALGESAVIYVGHAIGRGSLRLQIGSVTLSDDANGTLVATAGYTGTVDYTTGAIALRNGAAPINSNVSVSAQPAAALAAAGRTAATAITISNRAYTYVKTLSPAPAPGSVEVAYRAQDKWYSLFDDGVGGLVGDAGTGSGRVDYATGAITLTVGALPDADTSLLFTWGSPDSVEAHVGGNVFSLPSIKFTISGGALTPGSLSISYNAGGVARTVTDNGSGGLVGQGSGYVDYANGLVVVRPSLLPDANADLEVTYAQGLAVAEVFAAAGAVNNFSLAHSVKPGTVSIVFSDAAGNGYRVGDNGAGVLVLLSSTSAESTTNALVSSRISSTAISGSVNYTTGSVSLAATISVSQAYFTGHVFQTSTVSVEAAGSIAVSYRQATDSDGGPQTASVPFAPMAIDLLPEISNSLIPGSLRFSIGSDTFVDRAGTLVRNPSHLTNSGTPAGTINYLTGTVTLTSWAGGVAPGISVSALTRLGAWTDWQIAFRTSGAPLQSSSLYISAVRADTGAIISATADSSGVLAGTNIEGRVDTTTGVVSVRFGSMVAAAGHESEWWYNADEVVSGQIFRPLQVLPETAKYNAVATASLPLSADILGLDPVRLPADGRVPIFRQGDVIVVHHEVSTDPATVSNGQTVNLGRVRLERVRVRDANGQKITTGFTADLDAGSVTFSSVSGYAQPVTIQHRIADMAVVSDVQINGSLAITRPLTHDYPLGSYVSSAMVIGSMHARVSVFFDQQTWSGWSDGLQGSAATGTYNKTQYPVAVTNRGAIRERWEIVFTNTTSVNVIGESIGQVMTNASISETIAPINPATGTPYFTLSALGWGAGWSAGNMLRFNTEAANFPIWVARTVLQGNPSVNADEFSLGIRGDIDA